MPTSAPRPSVNHLLRPLSWLYGLGVGARNLLFDTGVLTETAFDLPVICVGNLAVGGTGKTPHADYLVRLLEDAGLRVALLSRGYKRSSHGWQLAGPRSTSADIGDEPLQIYRRHPRAIVAVDADRRGRTASCSTMPFSTATSVPGSTSCSPITTVSLSATPCCPPAGCASPPAAVAVPR